jgi:DNA-cytosine methyltransferase
MIIENTNADLAQKPSFCQTLVTGSTGLNVLSLFDGMSCGQIALQRAGIKVENYFASEIDKHAIQVTQHNYTNTIQIGDVTKVKVSDLPKIDLLIGGSPCQGFSFAGKQLNFDDPRSKLFFEFVRLLKETKAKYFLLENVLMKKEYEQIITDHLGVEPIFINSALVSAQNRKRLYWTNIPNVTEPKDKGITWGDVRERGVNTECYYYTEKAMQWLARVSQKKNKTLMVHSDADKMQMLEASHHKKYSNQRFFGIVDLPKNEQAIAAMRGRYLIAGKRQDGKQKTKGLTKQYIEFRYDGKTNALTTVTKDNVVVPFTLPNRIPADEFFFRYITPLECERLQTVPDGYTSCVSDTQRYKMLGNGWTVDVIAHIFGGLS